MKDSSIPTKKQYFSQSKGGNHPLRQKELTTTQDLQHPQQWVLEILFYIHLRNRKSSATHTVRGGGASKASDGGEKNLITGT